MTHQSSNYIFKSQSCPLNPISLYPPFPSIHPPYETVQYYRYVQV